MNNKFQGYDISGKISRYTRITQSIPYYRSASCNSVNQSSKAARTFPKIRDKSHSISLRTRSNISIVTIGLSRFKPDNALSFGRKTCLYIVRCARLSRGRFSFCLFTDLHWFIVADNANLKWKVFKARYDEFFSNIKLNVFFDGR